MTNDDVIASVIEDKDKYIKDSSLFVELLGLDVDGMIKNINKYSGALGFSVKK